MFLFKRTSFFALRFVDCLLAILKLLKYNDFQRDLWKAKKSVFWCTKVLSYCMGCMGAFTVYRACTTVEVFSWELCMEGKACLNMPAFFALSGYFALSTFRTGTWSKILARVSLFAWPRASFAIIFVVIEILICMPSFRGVGATWSLFLGIYRSRWFLRTLGGYIFYLQSSFD